ncbi:hCG2007771 [Homo sapiens]|nr:hCG2007771 [Homo sapiens]|eukprot:NP_001307952.1 uncharacterized protein LOC150051 [Homo sapiens]
MGARRVSAPQPGSERAAGGARAARAPEMPSCEAPSARPGEIARRQRRRGGPGDDQGAPNKAALGGPEASASLGDRSAKLPVISHRWRWPMACTDGALVGARARLGIGGIGRRLWRTRKRRRWRYSLERNLSLHEAGASSSPEEL